MASVEAVNTVAGAFAAGLVTSVHCAGMCGPLACGWTALGAKKEGSKITPALYQTGRVVSYAVLGLIGGLLGMLPMAFLKDSPVALLPWALVILFLVVALGLDKKIPMPAAIRMGMMKVRWKLSQLATGGGGFMLGVATPLLPCGPLYLMLGVAMASGSAFKGAEMMFAFALGTIPLLWVAQTSVRLWADRIRMNWLIWFQRGFALTAALALMWRLRGTLWFVEGVTDCGCGG